jgi:hypothetical protein
MIGGDARGKRATLACFIRGVREGAKSYAKDLAIDTRR